MKKINSIFTVFALVAMLCACDRKNDYIQIFNRSSKVIDDVGIDILDGYFYDSHEKFIVDEHTIGVTVYFTRGNDAGWKGGRSDG